jgi:DNA-binding NarL/FixJ family response regulator
MSLDSEPFGGDVRDPHDSDKTSAEAQLANLTSRERETLKLLGAGLTNREIATRLGISIGTAQRHVANTYRKLGVTNRVQAAQIAFASANHEKTRENT